MNAKIMNALHHCTFIAGRWRLQAATKRLREMYETRLSEAAADYGAQLSEKVREISTLKGRLERLEETKVGPAGLCSHHNPPSLQHLPSPPKHPPHFGLIIELPHPAVLRRRRNHTPGKNLLLPRHIRMHA